MVTLMYGTALLLLCSSSGNSSSSDTSGGGVVFCLDVAWLFFLTVVRNMVFGI